MKLLLPVSATFLVFLPDVLAVVCKIEVTFKGQALGSKYACPGVLKHISGYWCLPGGEDCKNPNCAFGEDFKHLEVHSSIVRPSSLTAEEMTQAHVPDTGTEGFFPRTGSDTPSAPPP
ncbi:hypothetical protein PspLS_10474 [Pyricularia sp. CBS 133598]|nr:hypothetical protein PspLS_10474 [Pyricularia sp. CBS 133598]